jgi:hypothetical protein
MIDRNIIGEYRARSASARIHREAAFLLMVVAAVVLGLYGLNRTRMEMWAGLVLAAGIVLLVLSFALAMLSLLKLRCPVCSRILGTLHDAAYCPGCGAALMDDGWPEGAPAPKARPRARTEDIRALARRDWQPRSMIPAGDEYPEEAYPKDIRLFTTSDETELTRRYIRLIDKDERRRSAEDDPFAKGAAETKSRKTRRPATESRTAKKEDRPDWRRADPEAEGSDLLSRIVGRFRRL